MFKHEYLELNMGLVKENFVIAKRSERKLWESRGFKKIRKYPIFHYFPKPSEVVMLGKPCNIRSFGTQNIKGCRITDFCPYLGTYGMGGPGFAGFQFIFKDELYWLVYCIWLSGEHILLDERIIECHPDFQEKYDPWIKYSNQNGTHQSNFVEKFTEWLKQMTIEDVSLSDEKLTIKLLDSSNNIHTLHTEVFSDKFPEQAGTGVKRKSFKQGKMEDYWLVIYDRTHLKV